MTPMRPLSSFALVSFPPPSSLSDAPEPKTPSLPRRPAARSRPRPAEKTNMTLKGSDTMVILGQRWAEAYMKANSGDDHPGDRGRIRNRHRRPHQWVDRHL